MSDQFQADLKRTPRVKPQAGESLPDRQPPYSHEAEEGVLSCCIQDPQNAINACIERLTARGDEFYDLRHQTIYRALVEIYNAQEPVDMISLQEYMKLGRTLDQVGGLQTLLRIQDTAPSAANLNYYLDIICERYVLRNILRVCTDTASRVYEFDGNYKDLLDKAERDILAVGNVGATAEVSVKTLVNEAINAFEEQWNRHGQLGGISTGFADLDRLTDGLHNGEMIVIAARPSLGKTSLMMNIVEHVTLNLGLPAGVFSLEMTGQSLIQRCIRSQARIAANKMRDNQLTQVDYAKLTDAAGKLAKAPLYIDDRGGLSIMQIRAKARRWHQQYGIKLVAIDYLQLANAQGAKRKSDSRQDEITEISAGIKAMAKELNVPVLVASQLNRDIEREKGRKPKMSDLRESGSIEQDADVIGFLYRPEDPEEKPEDETGDYPILVNLLLEKQRNGKRHVDVPFTFFEAFTRFETAARVSDADIP